MQADYDDGNREVPDRLTRPVERVLVVGAASPG